MPLLYISIFLPLSPPPLPPPLPPRVAYRDNKSGWGCQMFVTTIWVIACSYLGGWGGGLCGHASPRILRHVSVDITSISRTKNCSYTWHLRIKLLPHLHSYAKYHHAISATYDDSACVCSNIFQT